MQQAYPNLDEAAQTDAACIHFREAIRCEDVRHHVEHLKYYECLQDLVDEADLVARIHPRAGSSRQSRMATAVHRVKEGDSEDAPPSVSGGLRCRRTPLDEHIAEVIGEATEDSKSTQPKPTAIKSPTKPKPSGGGR